MKFAHTLTAFACTGITLLLLGCSQHTARQPDTTPYGLANPTYMDEGAEAEFPSTLKSSPWPSELNEYLREVLDANPNLKALNTHLNAALVARQQQPNRWTPEASVYAKAERQGAFERNNTPSNTRNGFSMGADVNWSLDIWGRIANQQRAQTLSLAEQEATLFWSRRLLIGDALGAWVEDTIRREQVTQAASLLKFQRVLDDTLTEQYRQGRISYREYRQQQREYHQYAQQLRQIRYQSQNASAQRNALKGQPPKAQAPHTTEDFTLPDLPQPMTIERLAERPDIQGKFIHVQKADQEAFAAHKALLPQLTLSASLSQSSDDINTLLDQNTIWRLVGGITQPLFFGNELKANAARASTQAEAALYEYQHTVLQAMLDVSSKLNAERQQADQLALAEQAWQDQDTLSKEQQALYHVGKISLEDVLTGQIKTVLAKVAWQNERINYIKQRISLAIALGEPLEQLIQ